MEVSLLFNSSILQLGSKRLKSCQQHSSSFVRSFPSSLSVVPFLFLFPAHFVFSDSDKHESGSVGQVSKVQQEVEGSEHRHSDQV